MKTVVLDRVNQDIKYAMWAVPQVPELAILLISYIFSCCFFLNQPSAIAFSESFCEPLYPCVSLWCVQEFSDAILEWQPSLQAWLRSMELILVPRVKGERESMCRAKRLSCPRLRAVWCYQTHHISPLKPLFVCLHNKCLPRYSDKENMKVTFHWWQGSVCNCNHITV